jgi:hypothetical protein
LLVLSAYTAAPAAAAAAPAAPEAAAPSADAGTELRAASDILKTHHMNPSLPSMTKMSAAQTIYWTIVQ